jgi:hypothetical protein
MAEPLFLSYFPATHSKYAGLVPNHENLSAACTYKFQPSEIARVKAVPNIKPTVFGSSSRLQMSIH